MVNTSLFSGLSGLRVHQQYIDVIGNNLANVSTPGFWGSRITFSDILSFTQTAGSGPSGNFGGTNPRQVGLGVGVGSIDLRTEQGTFQDTGRALDVAIQGRGFFTLNDGLRSLYTRVGTFGVDASRNLVDLRSGYRVVSASGGNITVPVTDTLPPRQTGEITFQGNLPAVVGGPLEEIVESASAFREGQPASKTTGAEPFNITGFDGKSILVSVNGGAQQTITFPAGTTTYTAAALETFLGPRMSGVEITVNGGRLTFDTTKLGESASLKFDDGPGAAGFLAALGLDAALTSGTESAATTSTDLAQLTSRISPYQAGDQIQVRGTNPDGSAVSDTFVYGTSGTTLDDLLTFVNNRFTGATATLTTDGTLRLTANQKEPANLSLFIGDAAGNRGSSSYPSFRVVQDGAGPDQAVTSIDVIDSLGRTHPVQLTFERDVNDSSVWSLTASMDASEGTVASGTVSQIRFNADGSFNVIGGGSNQVSFLFDGIATTQDVTLNLGTSGQFDGVAMLGDRTTVAATNQDGFETGTLLTVNFDQQGNLTGYYSNGEARTLDSLRVAVFPNEAGLLRVGDTMFVESPNSDDAIVTTAGAAGAGLVRPGSLENSNVDIAQEFVSLIEAQRGFQANSRVITTTDEILAELVNIVR
ncbi:MAG: flagellar hook-basal body complex protein [Planctomycetota bacterium]